MGTPLRGERARAEPAHSHLVSGGRLRSTDRTRALKRPRPREFGLRLDGCASSNLRPFSLTPLAGSFSCSRRLRHRRPEISGSEAEGALALGAVRGDEEPAVGAFEAPVAFGLTGHQLGREGLLAVRAHDLVRRLLGWDLGHVATLPERSYAKASLSLRPWVRRLAGTCAGEARALSFGAWWAVALNRPGTGAQGVRARVSSACG